MSRSPSPSLLFTEKNSQSELGELSLLDITILYYRRTFPIPNLLSNSSPSEVKLFEKTMTDYLQKNYTVEGEISTFERMGAIKSFNATIVIPTQDRQKIVDAIANFITQTGSCLTANGQFLYRDMSEKIQPKIKS